MTVPTPIELDHDQLLLGLLRNKAERDNAIGDALHGIKQDVVVEPEQDLDAVANDPALLAKLAAIKSGQPQHAGAIPSQPPSEFDGGAREPAIAPGDPMVEHNALIVNALHNTRSGRGGWDDD